VAEYGRLDAWKTRGENVPTPVATGSMLKLLGADGVRTLRGADESWARTGATMGKGSAEVVGK
jgi:hypothetical protein